MDSLALDVDARSLQTAARQLTEEAARIERDLTELTRRRAALLADALKTATPVSRPQGDEPEHTPHAADLWTEQTTPAGESVVANPAPYLLWQLTGTHDHFVAPVHAAALHFWSAGVEHFSRGHMVRGISPNETLLRAIDDQQRSAADDLRVYGAQIAARLAAEVR
jgi:hypothetical protein